MPALGGEAWGGEAFRERIAGPGFPRAVQLSLGSGLAATTIFARVYPQIRLPVYTVLAHSLSAVDVALTGAANTGYARRPGRALDESDPELALRFRAAAGCDSWLSRRAAIGG